MKLLILGGTAFVGRHLAEAALSRGHEVSLFNRGQRNPGLFPEAEHLVGDRDGGLGVLTSGRWDAVIDTSGYVPRLVKDSAALLASRVGRYAFISTISVYAEPKAGMDEDAPLGTLEDPTVEAVTKETYGPLKVLCEQAVSEVYGERSLIVRPGIIAGPHDPTDRFTYWARAMARGGTVLAPAPATAPVQVIDARDLADWTLRMVEGERSGIFNATGPAGPLDRQGFLEALGRPEAPARIGWLDAAALTEAGVDPYAAFPFYTEPAYAGLLAVNSARALAAGLTLRPLAETARDTLAWLASEGERQLKVGLAPESAARLEGLAHF